VEKYTTYTSFSGSGSGPGLIWLSQSPRGSPQDTSANIMTKTKTKSATKRFFILFFLSQFIFCVKKLYGGKNPSSASGNAYIIYQNNIECKRLQSIYQ
jgi:hypothetical protein